ncbi:hypothetical protein P167DRAFT_126556 [Morchella conica CCBAS932]|uniref:Uncharacterized protein n=1 Tax=Morchella conica CCBAS932 TaxID=1392247 RepID=A0A3N4L6C8_9PEZI|nr:hypothetical protein P167DRAFT_126556 [Morchella conica CCBAS932]
MAQVLPILRLQCTLYNLRKKKKTKRIHSSIVLFCLVLSYLGSNTTTSSSLFPMREDRAF